MFVAGLQRFFSEEKGTPVRLCNPENHVFKPLHATLDNLYRELHRSGIGTTRKRAEVVSADEENQLWTSGVLSCDTPKRLLSAVFITMASTLF